MARCAPHVGVLERGRRPGAPGARCCAGLQCSLTVNPTACAPHAHANSAMHQMHSYHLSYSSMSHHLLLVLVCNMGPGLTSPCSQAPNSYWGYG